MNQISSHEMGGQQVQQQLALEIFETMGMVDIPIVDTGRDFELRKSHLLVDVSDVGLLARRVLNGAYFIAQGSPESETHTVDLRYFKWLINYANSNNNTHLKRVIREAQKSAVQVNVIDPSSPAEENWVSVPMLGAAGIRRNQISFKIPVELRGQLRDPERYSLLSMRILAGFSSQYSLELYERLSAFKEAGTTPWWSLDEFRSMIRVDGLKIANDFRYFKRDIILPAITQINEISDIDVGLELRRTGRFFSHIRFSVHASSKHRLLNQVATSKELYEVLTVEFGLSEAELDEISSNRDKWNDDRLLAAIEFTRHRMRTGTVKYPGKYLMTAIRDGCRVSAHELRYREEAAQQAAQRQAQQATLELARAASPIADAVALPEGEALARAWAEFSTSASARLFKALPATYAEADARARKAFAGWLASAR